MEARLEAEVNKRRNMGTPSLSRQASDASGSLASCQASEISKADRQVSVASRKAGAGIVTLKLEDGGLLLNGTSTKIEVNITFECPNLTLSLKFSRSWVVCMHDYEDTLSSIPGGIFQFA